MQWTSAVVFDPGYFGGLVAAMASCTWSMPVRGCSSGSHEPHEPLEPGAAVIGRLVRMASRLERKSLGTDLALLIER